MLCFPSVITVLLPLILCWPGVSHGAVTPPAGALVVRDDGYTFTFSPAKDASDKQDANQKHVNNCRYCSD